MIPPAAPDALSDIGYAKINLALHIRARRADGKHELETIFAFLDDGDHVSAQIADQTSLEISGLYGKGLSAGADNLVLQAALLLKAHFGITQGAKLNLIKHLPIASGIGGGSADAAAAARLLNQLWGIEASNDALAALLAPLGADIPACIFSNTQLGKGLGTTLSPLSDELRGTHVLLVNPNIALQTAPVFRAWDGQDRGGLLGDRLWEILSLGRNDLQAPAITLCPAIANILDALKRYDPQLARMSGSGATCFAVFSSEDRCLKVQAEIYSEYPQWWTMAGILR